MKEKKKYSLLEKIVGIAILLSIPGIIVMLALASNKIISAGIPIISFGVLFIIIILFGKDTDDSIRNKRVGKIIFITLGFGIISIGISIIYKSIMMFIYSFVNLFGIAGLSVAISLIYRYIYNKKYCTKRVSAICSDIIEDRYHSNRNYIITTRPVFTIRNEEGKTEKLVYDISGYTRFVIGQTYELMVNPENHNEFYVLEVSYFKENLIPIIISSIMIMSSIAGNLILLTSNWTVK